MLAKEGKQSLSVVIGLRQNFNSIASPDLVDALGRLGSAALITQLESNTAIMPLIAKYLIGTQLLSTIIESLEGGSNAVTVAHGTKQKFGFLEKFLESHRVLLAKVVGATQQELLVNSKYFGFDDLTAEAAALIILGRADKYLVSSNLSALSALKHSIMSNKVASNSVAALIKTQYVSYNEAWDSSKSIGSPQWRLASKEWVSYPGLLRPISLALYLESINVGAQGGFDKIVFDTEKAEQAVLSIKPGNRLISPVAVNRSLDSIVQAWIKQTGPTNFKSLKVNFSKVILKWEKVHQQMIIANVNQPANIVFDSLKSYASIGEVIGDTSRRDTSWVDVTNY